MAAIRKLVSVKTSAYPSSKIAAKVKKTVLGDATAKFLTRKDISTLLKSDVFAKAPKTAAYLKELKALAKSKGAYYIRLS